MANPRKTYVDPSKDQKAWRNVMDAASARLKELGGELIWSPHQYEVARWNHPGCVLILYSHKTSAGNYHVRVRAGKVTDRGILRQAIVALAENSCQFYCPTERGFHSEGVNRALEENRSFTH